MSIWFRSKIRHPFYPKLNATPAAEANGRVIALSGTFHELERAAATGASAQRAVFVKNTCNRAPLTDDQRDRLWSLFQVPTYAMVLDGKGRLAAFECEAQNGFHVPGKTAPDSALCACGRPGLLSGTELPQTMPELQALFVGT